MDIHYKRLQYFYRVYQPHRALGVFFYTHRYATALSLSHALCSLHTQLLQLTFCSTVLCHIVHTFTLEVFIIIYHMGYLQMKTLLHIITIITTIIIIINPFNNQHSIVCCRLFDWWVLPNSRFLLVFDCRLFPARVVGSFYWRDIFPTKTPVVPT